MHGVPRMRSSEWKQTARMWWGPAVTYLLASVLSLSQKQSRIAVIILLSVCTLWTWIVILALHWWTDASGWKRIVRTVVPLPVLVILLWGAIVFFRPETPPKSYPWLSTNTFVGMDGQRIKAVQLHVFVREEPVSPEILKGAMPLSSLYDLNLRVFTPQLVTQNGTYSCFVGQPIKAVEWNNSDATQKPVGIFQLQQDTNVLEFSGSSRNATWRGTVLIHSNGNWEESLIGWVDIGRGHEPVRVEETRKNNVTVSKLEHPIQVTPELLIKYGVPFKEKFDSAKDVCPPVS